MTLLDSLQRIADHWGIGTIENFYSFDTISNEIDRHFLETSQGEFEIFSYNPYSKTAEKALTPYLLDRHGQRDEQLVHAFDKYHVLLRLRQKWSISAVQATIDLALLTGKKVVDMYRVYGSILQLELEDESILVSYADWKIQDSSEETGEPKILTSTELHYQEELDAGIEKLAADPLIIDSYKLQPDWFELHFTNGKSLQFRKAARFPAIEMRLQPRKNTLLIFDEHTIFYSKEL